MPAMHHQRANSAAGLSHVPVAALMNAAQPIRATERASALVVGPAKAPMNSGVAGQVTGIREIPVNGLLNARGEGLALLPPQLAFD